MVSALCQTVKTFFQTVSTLVFAKEHSFFEFPVHTHSHKGRPDKALMQQYNMQDSREVVRKCKTCTAKPCLTVLRRDRRTGRYELSERCWRCNIDKWKCEWPAGASIENAEHRLHVEPRQPMFTEDRSVPPKPLGLILAQSNASACQVAVDLPHKNTMKAMPSTRPSPGPSSVTVRKQAKHTSRNIPQLPFLKAENDLNGIDIHAGPNLKPEVIEVNVIESPVPVEGGDEKL